MTPEQKEYAQKIAIVALGGGLLGSLIGQFASDPPTMGKTLIGTILGGALCGVGYGFYLRTGGEGGQAKMAGLGQRLAQGSYGLPRNLLRAHGRVIYSGAPGRFRNLGALGARLPKGSCIEVG